MTDFDETRKARGKQKYTPPPPKYKYRIMTKCPSCGMDFTFPSNVLDGDFYCSECKIITDVKKVLR